MTNMLRKTLTGVVAAASLGAMVIATSSPAAAWGRRGGWGPGPIVAGVLGGLALGAVAASAAQPAYVAPAYGPVYGPVCHSEWRPVYRSDGLYLRDRLVRVCD